MRRVKLFSHYAGESPAYAADFARRVGEIGIVEWEPLFFPIVADFNRAVAEALGALCNKKDGHSFSDARPMFAEVFPERVKGFEWWGWCELDVVLGDLDSMLPPLLDAHDAVSAFHTAVCGPLMLFRNRPDVNNLFRHGNWEQVLAEPGYCNFEEIQGEHRNRPGGMTKILRESGLPAHWDDRFSLWWETDPAFPTPATCWAEGKQLFEVPTGRELMIYHFNHTKRWPDGC